MSSKMNINRKRPADTQEAEWVAGEDRFVLHQAKRKAAIRVKEGRAKPIDWLAVTLRFIDSSRNPWDDEVEDSELDVVDPEGVLEGLSLDQLKELEKDIDIFLSLESNKTNKDFWETMRIICKEHRQIIDSVGSKGRSQETVSDEVDRMFSAKSFDQLEALEQQIRNKLRSDEPIDFEYWENLLHKLISWKAKAKLKRVSQSIIHNQMQGLRQQQEQEASRVKEKVMSILVQKPSANNDLSSKDVFYSEADRVDPEPLLKIQAEDKGLEMKDEKDFLNEIAHERQRVLKLGFIPAKRKKPNSLTANNNNKSEEVSRPSATRPGHNEEFSQATTALYEREVARGVNENEEIFTNEEDISSADKPKWSDKYRPRKPRYFNRVQMGYEWNKYNQTHYDHDNPPPKVVQGYKFNIFYPDLIEKAKAPTYKIEREHGRKRGQSFAPAGQEDTCVIRFISGPPYEDIAFRIVDKEWDYSAKRDRGFRSSFDKGILQLHFQFKKIFYRK